MKSILMAFLSVLSISLSEPETVLEIKSSSFEIKGRLSDGFYKQETSQFKSFLSTLNSDVFEYYGIKDQYKTDSKKKAYIESEDYKLKYSKLMELKSQVLSKKSYLDFEPEYYETDNLKKHNTDTRNFSVLNEIEGASFYNETGYIQFDRILFKCPTGILATSRNVNYVCNAFIEEAISFKINNDSLALKIRENSRDLRLLFVFSITGTKPFQSTSTDQTSANYYLMTSLDKVIVYNTKTNEIYCTYK